MVTSRKSSEKRRTARDPRLRSRLPLLEDLSPELRDLVVGFLDSLLNLDQEIQRYRRQQGEGTKGLS